MKSLVFILIIFCPILDVQQEANCTLQLHSNSYINDYSSAKAFFNSGIANEAIDPEFIDKDLLEASIYFMMDSKRPRSSRNQLAHSKPIESGATQILKATSANKLKWSMRKRKTPARHWKKVIKPNGFNGTYLELMSANIPIYDVPRRFKIRYDSKAEEGAQFYYMVGNKRKIAAVHTYESLVRTIFKDAYYSGWKALIRSKGLSDWGFAFRLEEGKSERSVKSLSVLVVGGGYRMGGLDS